MPNTIKEFWNTNLGKWALGLVTLLIIGAVNQFRTGISMKTVQDQMVLDIQEIRSNQTKLLNLVQSGQVSETDLSGQVDTENAKLKGEIQLNTLKIDTHIAQKVGAHK